MTASNVFFFPGAATSRGGNGYTMKPPRTLRDTMYLPMRGGGRTLLLLALVIWPLNTHPFRDEAPSFYS